VLGVGRAARALLKLELASALPVGSFWMRLRTKKGSGVVVGAPERIEAMVEVRGLPVGMESSRAERT
jgi:hypothetical protein